MLEEKTLSMKAETLYHDCFFIQKFVVIDF